ncbi:hypothetical protein MMN66_24405, partial [Escherichia coli]|nr:hypothetical protein [Escherichia coli]
MGIFNRIKKALGLEVRKGFRRWSTSELEEKKAYLENKSAEEFTAKDLNRPGFPGECFICELRLPDHRFRWKHNKLFLLLPEEY